MKAFLIIVAALFLVGCKSGSQSGSTAAAQVSKPAGVILDVRTPGEFEAGHIAGAINIPVNELESKIAAVVPRKDQAVFVHCQGGGRSARARTMLESKGYTNVTDLGSFSAAKQYFSK